MPSCVGDTLAADGKCYLFDLESLMQLNDAEDIDIEDQPDLLFDKI
jgi:hypothetical protein